MYELTANRRRSLSASSSSVPVDEKIIQCNVACPGLQDSRESGSRKVERDRNGDWGETGKWSLKALSLIPHSGVPTPDIHYDWSIVTVYFTNFVHNDLASRAQIQTNLASV